MTRRRPGSRSAADLVRSAGVALRGGGIAVPFVGLHADGSPQDACDAVVSLRESGPWAADQSLPVNALAARIGGVSTAILVGARGPERPQPTAEGPYRGRFAGQATANLSFLASHSQAAEGILVVRRRHSPVPSVPDCRVMTDALAELASLAAGAGCPILFAYTPSSPPPRGRKEARGDGSREQWRWVDRACIRFAVGMEASRPEARLRFYRRLTDYCMDQGFDLHLADRRFPRGGGRWFELAGAGASEDRAGRVAPAHLLLPVTFIGPARVGTTHAIIDHLARARVGVKGATVTSLGDLALINLVLAVSRERAADVAAIPRTAEMRPAAAALGEIAGAAGANPYVALTSDGSGRLTDYRCAVGAPRRPTPSSSRWRALWVAWEAPAAAESLWAVVGCLRAALARMEDDTGIRLGVEHFISRSVSEDVSRGRCKLSVPWVEGRSADVSHGVATATGDSVEEALARELSTLRPALGLNIELQVSPYEAFLGRWSLPSIPVS